MTLLVTSIFVEDLRRDLAAADRAFAEGSDAVELRIDPFEGDPAAIAEYVRSRSHKTWIVTCRSAEEGGSFRGDTMERVSRLIAAARGTGAYVDFELRDWRRSSNIQQKVLLAAAQSDGSHRLILSHHDFAGMPSDLPAIVRDVQSACINAIAKVAYHCEHINDSFAALDLMHEFGKRVIAIAMGEDGAWTRALAKKLGAFATYCSVDENAGTAPGQATLLDMTALWRRLDAGAKVYGVMGDPVAHSMSPALFNRWFTAAGIDAVYLPLRVRDGAGAFASFVEACRARPWLSVAGLSVTIPHKQSALTWLSDRADGLSRRIGAANTIVLDRLRIAGHNTDSYAAVQSLANALGCDLVGLSGLTVDVLGAGGSARALLEALRDVGARVTVFARSVKIHDALTREYGCKVRDWEQRTDRQGQVLVNCTPIGMWPKFEESPMPAGAFSNCRLVFDFIYNPLKTALLRDAKAAGCATLNGLDMFIRQAAMQFELWTGRTPDQETAREYLKELLGGSDPAAPLTQGVTPCIALIGMRGSGKTTVGRELGRLLGRDHVDLDDVIVERAGRSIAETFATEGEAGFRRRETEALHDVLGAPPAVLSVGGGAVLDAGSVALLRAKTTVVWLTAEPAVLRERIAADQATAASRPALTKAGAIDEVEEVLRQRASLYRSAANLTIETGHRAPEQIAREIVWFFRLGPARPGRGPVAPACS